MSNYACYPKRKKFIRFIKDLKVGFTVEQQLYIYVGGVSTSWDNLLPIFKQAIIDKYKNQ